MQNEAYWVSEQEAVFWASQYMRLNVFHWKAVNTKYGWKIWCKFRCGAEGHLTWRECELLEEGYNGL